MLTQRSRYALRAMLFLARAPAQSPPIPMTRIAAAWTSLNLLPGLTAARPAC